MKKKIFLILLVIALLIGSFFVGRQVGLNTEDSKTQTVIREEEVSLQDIKKTLTSSGYVSAKTTEKVELSTSKYFEAMCVEDDDTVSAGTNILKYTNGTYLTIDKDCVIISHSVPEADEKCTSSNYIEVSYLDTLTTTLSINENEINSIEIGQTVEITLSADESKTYEGKITKIDSVGTYATSGTTFSVTVEFENDGNVKLGMGVSCTIILQEEADTVAVSIDAVAENSNGEEYVTIVNSNGETEEKIVETGIADDNYVQITSGLSVGDKVQIETELTESTSSSSESSSFGNFGGGKDGSQGDMQDGASPDMSNFDPSSMGGGGDMPNFNG